MVAMFIKCNVGVFIKINNVGTIALAIPSVEMYSVSVLAYVRDNMGIKLIIAWFVTIRNENEPKCPPREVG